MQQQTYITPEQAAERLHYTVAHFRRVIMKRDLVEGVHFVRAFDGRKFLIIWERLEAELLHSGGTTTPAPDPSDASTPIPLHGGGQCNV
ncbi:hypothetical protein KHP57_04805 [Algiphilus sp. NNCM1]|uniref:hypothetical protein n=1 Tax=Algiphilus sp. TaxID=1872431 RepID=UPI001CA6B6C4|nr:hypothetical protein [Algiphilus sp.]MBY8965017.1 hypothetical protein [Algiphilus acroporae]MCI5104173.1 hypothetical protein [Algiphilus sp.]